MKLKRILALLLAVVMVFALAACSNKTDDTKANTEGGKTPETEADNPSSGNELAGTYEIKVWCAENVVELMKKQIDDFNAKNTDGIVIKATVQNVGEGDAATQMITDVDAGGDLFCFADDQFARLVQAGALSKLGTQASEFVTKNNDAGSVKAATINGEIYAYPMTADNTYFMYYDKTVITDPTSLDKIIADCEAADKQLCFDLGNGWYLASFFFGAGCTSDWATDKDGHWVVNDTFDSAEGLIAMKGMNKVMSSPKFDSKSNAAEFDNGAAVVVSGTWDSGTAKSILGDKMGVAALPKFTVDGKDYELGSFMGYKMVGVKPQSDAVKAAALHKLAQYLTGAEAQTERFSTVGWGPSNLDAMKSDAVQNDPVLAAVAEQAKRAVVQNVPDGWWNLAAALSSVTKETGDEAALKEALKTYHDGIELLKNLKPGLLFVGAWNGWNNAAVEDTYMLSGDGDVLSLTLEVPESDYMGGRIVNNGKWESDKGYAQITTGKELAKDLGADNPDNNIVFVEAGTYKVTINTATNEITLEKVG